MEPDQKAQIEEYKLAEIKRRINNWVKCYQDVPKEITSSTLLVMKAIRFARFDPNNDPDSHIFKPSSSCYVDPANLQDAMLLESAWQQMGTRCGGNALIGDTNITVRTAKEVVHVYAFGNGRTRRIYLRKNFARQQIAERVEKVSLLYFWECVFEAEKERSKARKTLRQSIIY